METVEKVTLQRRYLSLVDETEEDQADTLKFSFSSASFMTGSIFMSSNYFKAYLIRVSYESLCSFN